MIAITLDLSDTDVAALDLINAQETLIKKAAQRALNKTGRWLRTYLSRETAKKFDIKIRLIRPGLTLIGARQNALRSLVGLRPTAGIIKAKDLGRARQNTTGVRVGNKTFDHAFLATMPNGHEGVFRRKSDTRLPLREQVIVVTGYLSQLMDSVENGLAQQELKKNFEREYRFLARRTG